MFENLKLAILLKAVLNPASVIAPSALNKFIVLFNQLFSSFKRLIKPLIAFETTPFNAPAIDTKVFLSVIMTANSCGVIPCARSYQCTFKFPSNTMMAKEIATHSSTPD